MPNGITHYINILRVRVKRRNDPKLSNIYNKSRKVMCRYCSHITYHYGCFSYKTFSN